MVNQLAGPLQRG